MVAEGTNLPAPWLPLRLPMMNFPSELSTKTPIPTFGSMIIPYSDNSIEQGYSVVQVEIDVEIAIDSALQGGAVGLGERGIFSGWAPKKKTSEIE